MKPAAFALDLLKRTLDGSITEDPNVASWANEGYDSALRAVGKDWPKTAHTMIGRKRLDNLQACIEAALENDVPGDVVETGVWRGGASILARGVLKAHGILGRQVWACDSFEGLPEPEAAQDEGDRHHTNPFLAVSLEEVKRNFDRYGLLDDQVTFVKGWFKDTLHKMAVSRIAVLRLDGDMYQSTMDALTALYPKLSKGGYLIVDDYHVLESCRRAVTDYRTAHDISEPIVEIDGSGVFWRRENLPVTFVIPTLTEQGAKRTARLIRDAARGSRPPDKFFVIDNGGKAAELAFWLLADSTITGVSERVDVFSPGKNLGVAAAWNEALRRYPNSWLIICNDDIEIEDDTIECFIQASAETDAVLVGCELDYGYPCFLIKPEVVAAIGYFDEQFFPAYGEDNDYTRRISLAGLKKTQVAVGVREPAPGATSRDLDLDRAAMKQRAAIRYSAKWGGLPDQETLHVPRFADLVPEVFIATVPWRRSILEEMLRDISKDPPRRVHLFLDGYAGHANPEIPRDLDVIVHRNDGKPRGPGPRWYAAAVAPEDTLAITIDDDMKIDSDYVTRTVAAWTRLKEPFSWGGGGLSWGMPGHYSKAAEKDTRLFCIGAGTAAVPARLLRGISDDSDAADFLGHLGHDEVFISWWLRAHRLWRPAGPAVTKDTEGTHDPRSQWAFRDRLLPLERRMLARGWEVPEGYVSAKSVKTTAKAKGPVVSIQGYTPPQNRFKR